MPYNLLQTLLHAHFIIKYWKNWFIIARYATTLLQTFDNYHTHPMITREGVQAAANTSKYL